MPSRIKQHGIHYTPRELATFLAEQTAQHADLTGRNPVVLDPACGDGALLHAFCDVVPTGTRKKLKLVGYETDTDALSQAQERLTYLPIADLFLDPVDFLSLDGVDVPFNNEPQQLLFDDAAPSLADVVIANPPYVRTQVLGAKKSQELARRFGLSGRVDLYHAFVIGMANVLKPGGVLGLLTSNRFLTIKSGITLRRLLHSEFELEAIHDLGDTRLFSAAVLPVIVIGRKRNGEVKAQDGCSFNRIYEHRQDGPTVTSGRVFSSVLDALRETATVGVIQSEAGVFNIDRGILVTSPGDEVWSLSTPDTEDWLGIVEDSKYCTFGDVSHVRVGVKTTADEVFIDGWSHLKKADEPEPALIKPLLTHHNAARWIADSTTLVKSILYPHTIRNGQRKAVDLDSYPRARAYLESQGDRLRRRKYVLDAGREWFEIWVPHNPGDWKKPKIVYPDISEFPRFWMDTSGAIVNGDCYWITMREGKSDEWLPLMLAVANSTFIVKYYDAVFHNKLYAGRRRFMTQYVKQFPLPDVSSPVAKKLITSVRQIHKKGTATKAQEERINRLVWEAFGLVEEVGG